MMKLKNKKFHQSRRKNLHPAKGMPKQEESFELHVEISGRGEPLILLHGNGEDSTYFKNQIPFLSRHFEVHAIDSRGHGKTPHGNLPMTIRQFAADTAAYIHEHDLEKAHILGFSDGANIAMILGMEHPETAASLVLDGGNLKLSGIKTMSSLEILAVWKFASVFKWKKKSELYGLMVKDPNIRKEDLARIQVPTLVIAGDRDVIRKSHTMEIAESIPDSRLSIIKGTHFAAAENPNLFNHILARFYQSIHAGNWPSDE